MDRYSQCRGTKEKSAIALNLALDMKQYKSDMRAFQTEHRGHKAQVEIDEGWMGADQIQKLEGLPEDLDRSDLVELIEELADEKGFRGRLHSSKALANRGVKEWYWIKTSNLKTKHARGTTVGATKGANVDEADIKDASAKITQTLDDDFDYHVDSKMSERSSVAPAPKMKKTKEDKQTEKDEQSERKQQDILYLLTTLLFKVLIFSTTCIIMHARCDIGD